jgi:RND family efflux transporter MFP subunit
MTPAPDALDQLRIDHRDEHRGPSRAWIWVVLVVVLAAAGVGGWWWRDGAQAATVRTATVQAAAAGQASTVLNASGYVVARRRATVSSKVTGRVVDVLVEEGRAVRRGQVLARLDDSMARANLDLAEAQLAAARSTVAESEVRLAEAKLTLGRIRRLVEDGVVGRADLDAAEAEVESLEARIALARQQVIVAERQVAIRQTELDDTVIRAPFDGVAISKDAQPGEMVSPVSAGGGFTRTGISTIVDMSSLEIEVDVNENYINRVVAGQPVTAVLDAYPDWRIPAKVITTVPAADRQKATVLVRIGFDRLDPRLLPDMGVKVAFLREEDVAPAGEDRPRVFVPRAAVRQSDGESFVFLLRENRVDRRAVRLGSSDGDSVEVLAGLAAGDRIVLDPPATLADGGRVRVQ